MGAIENLAHEYEASDLALTEAVHTLLWVCLWAERAELWGPFDAVIARPGEQIDPVLDLNVKIVVDPVRTAAASLKQLDAAIEDLQGEQDPTQIVRVTNAAIYMERPSTREPLPRVIRDGRQGGAVTAALTAMVQLGFDYFATGQWDDALDLAGEGIPLAESSGFQLHYWLLEAVRAFVAGCRGDDATAVELSSEMIRWASPRGIGGVLTFARHLRTVAALSRGDFDEAYRQVTAISPAGTLPSHHAHVLVVPMYLVEAAVRTGRQDEARAHVAALKEAKVEVLSPRLALLVETFQGLGAQPWAARAASELRAAGQAGKPAIPSASAQLTPQELQIARLAAAGLTNKQIAERLFLSPRTVGSHLYRIFPRLGITTRAALRDALDRDPEAGN